MTPRVPIRVHRCTVTVRRRDGWSWGDPHELLVGALAAIEQALAAAAEETGLQPEDDVVLTGPVRLLVARDGTVAPAPGTDSLADRLARSREQHCPVPGQRPPGGSLPQRSAGAAAAAGETPSASGPPPAPAPDAVGLGLATALTSLSRGGALANVLAASPPPLLGGWLEALARACAAAAAPRAWPDEVLEAVCRRVLATAGAALLDADGRVLLVAGALLAAADGCLPSPEVLARLRATIGGAAGEADLPTVGQAQAPTVPAAPRSTPAAPKPTRPRSVPTPEEPEPPQVGAAVVPALPFLVVLQLGLLDYLAPAAAVLQLAGTTAPDGVEGLAGADRALAAMLAGKVLPPPAGGWRRESADREAVGLVAGLAPRRVDELLDRWAAPTRATVGTLDAVLDALDARDVDRSTTAEAALVDHRGLPGLEAESCERHLAAAVATGLGRLARDLWGEEADALLALTRLEDLQARVVVTGREVSIGLPRGQRWLDLRRIGLLDAWRVPWAAGGRWELVTW